MTLDTRLAWSEHVKQMGKKGPQKLLMLDSHLKKRRGLPVRNGVPLYKQLVCPTMDYACLIWRSAARSHVRRLQVLHFTCLRIEITHLDTLVTGKFTRIWGFHSSPTASEH
jgi:hypothetical protein